MLRLLAPCGALLAAAAVAGPAAAAPATFRAAASQAAVSLNFNTSLPGVGKAYTTLHNQGSLGGQVTVDVATAGGGQALQQSGLGSGRDVRLPAYSGSATGPRAVLRIRNAGSVDHLSPGRNAFSWGADFRLDSTSAGPSGSGDNGDNLVQRGLTDNQWKLQLDHRRAGCFVSGSAGWVSVTTTVAVSSTSWYRATCRRTVGTGAGVSVVLQRFDTGSSTWVGVESVTSAGNPGNVAALNAGVAMSVGGKLDNSTGAVDASSDQFNGSIDNVFYSPS